MSLARGLAAISLASFGVYNIMSGPNRTYFRRYFTMAPESGLISFATSHFCPTSFFPALVGAGTLSYVGQ